MRGIKIPKDILYPEELVDILLKIKSAGTVV